MQNAIASSVSKLDKMVLQDELQSARADLEYLLAHVPAVIYRLKIDGQKVTPNFVSENITRLLGFSVPEAMSYEWWEGQLHPDDRDRVVGTFDAALRHGKSTIEYRLQHKDGSYRWVSDDRRIIAASATRPAELLGILTDITERKDAEAKVDYLTRLPEESPNPVLRLGTDATVLYANPSARPLLEHWKCNVGDRLTGEWMKIVVDLTISQKNGCVEVECDDRYFSICFSPNCSGTINAYGHDITARKKMDEQLRMQAAALQTTANGIVITDVKGQIIWTNPAFTTLTGYTFEEAVGKNPRILKSGKHDKAYYRNLWNTLLGGKVWRGVFENRRKDGSIYQDEHTITPVRSSNGAITHFVAILNDISERQTAETQLRQSQKMEAVGQLAGGVAHDFNNLLTVINGHCQLMLNRLKPGEKMRDELDLILRTGERAAKLTHQLLAFSRKQILQPEIVNLNAITTNLHKMLRRLIREDIELSTILDAKLKPVKVDPTQIEQVIINLVVNARDAMPKGGRLTIETSNVVLDQEYCQTHVDAHPGGYSMISISDTGIGMSHEVKARIFEPFFTTKERGKGTGLGLSTVFGIVKQSSGLIEVVSEMGKGTTFKILIPQTLELPSAATSGDKFPAARACREVILLVEDEDTVRDLARDILELSGYTILLARNGQEALEICQANENQIDLLVSDVVMPQMGGLELADRLKNLRPATKLLLTSGYTDHPNIQESSNTSGIAFLHKPFTTVTLARKVREVLDRV
jgi:PAS domain S-box-containing protein